MGSDSEDYEYYAYSSEEEVDYAMTDEQDEEAMAWETDNPNAPPSTFSSGKLNIHSPTYTCLQTHMTSLANTSKE
jgi:hypothetical protein